MKNKELTNEILDLYELSKRRLLSEGFKISRTIDFKVCGRLKGTRGLTKYYEDDNTAQLTINKDYVTAILNVRDSNLQHYNNLLMSLITHELIHLIDDVIKSELENGGHCKLFRFIANQMNLKYNYNISIYYNYLEMYNDENLRGYYSKKYGWFKISCNCEKYTIVPGFHKATKQPNGYYCSQCNHDIKVDKLI